MELHILCFLLLTLTMTGMCGRKSQKQHRCSKRCELLDPSSLHDPELLKKMELEGMIYKESPAATYRLKNISKPDKLYFFCEEYLEDTVDLDRTPRKLVHRRCDGDDDSCRINPDGGKFAHTCEEQFTWRIVCVKNKWQYQKVFTGCACIATNSLDSNG